MGNKETVSDTTERKLLCCKLWENVKRIPENRLFRMTLMDTTMKKETRKTNQTWYQNI